MSDYLLRLSEARLAAGAGLASWRPANAMLYCAAGGVEVDGTTLAANEARHLTGPAAVRAGADGARLLCFALAAPGADPPPGEVLLAETVALDAAADHLMRCDRVDFPPGGIAYLHTHRGPGIRCLLAGHITVETEGHLLERAPFQAWFESGPAPVLARASERAPTAFVRVMLLPRALLGQSSIRYVRPEDREQPKTQRYTVFQDVPISL